tara:strand:- start:224 stop:589 length:366 start_codon:yes stop_codon:yes gene_type:complete
MENISEPGVKELKTYKELIKLVGEHRVVVLKASAEWCEPCKRIVPIFNKFIYDLPDMVSDINDISIVKIDIDVATDIKRALRIKAVPFLCNFVNGDLTDIVNTSREEDIVKFFTKTLSKLN